MVTEVVRRMGGRVTIMVINLVALKVDLKLTARRAGVFASGTLNKVCLQFFFNSFRRICVPRSQPFEMQRSFTQVICV